MPEEKPHIALSLETPNLEQFGISIPKLRASAKVDLPSIHKPNLNGIDALKIRFRLKWRARRDGRRGVPILDGKRLSAAERDIVGYWSSFKRRISATIQRARDAAEVYLMDDPGAPINAEHTVRAVSRALDNAITTPVGQARKLRRRAYLAVQEWHFFRKDNEIKRLPRLRKDPLTSLQGLFVAFVAETIFSFILISAALREDYLEASLLALLLCLLNTALGLASGFSLLRVSVYRNRNIAITAWVGFGAICALDLAYNLVLGKFRDSLAATGWSGVRVSIVDLANSTGGLASVSPESGVLVIVGLLTFGWACYKGRSTFSDPYLGYDDVETSREVAEDRYEYMLDRRRALADGIITTAVFQFQALQAELKARIQRAEMIEDRISELATEAPGILQDIADDCMSAIAFYREENAYHRSRKAHEAVDKAGYNEALAWDTTVVIDLAALTSRKEAFIARIKAVLDPLDAVLIRLDDLRDSIGGRITAFENQIEDDLKRRYDMDEGAASV